MVFPGKVRKNSDFPGNISGLCVEHEKHSFQGTIVKPLRGNHSLPAHRKRIGNPRKEPADALFMQSVKVEGFILDVSLTQQGFHAEEGSILCGGPVRQCLRQSAAAIQGAAELLPLLRANLIV